MYSGLVLHWAPCGAIGSEVFLRSLSELRGTTEPGLGWRKGCPGSHGRSFEALWRVPGWQGVPGATNVGQPGNTKGQSKAIAGHSMMAISRVVRSGFLAGSLLGFLLSFWLNSGGRVHASQWVFLRSNYSHSPDGSHRVTQFQPEPTVILPEDPTYIRSGFRHREMHLRAGRSADRLHVVETWGMGAYLRPYGEWEYPYRAGATPFGPWGNPQGPWTLPFDSWVNPYGLGQLPSPPWYLYGPWIPLYPVIPLAPGAPGGGSGGTGSPSPSP